MPMGAGTALRGERDASRAARRFCSATASRGSGARASRRSTASFNCRARRHSRPPFAGSGKCHFRPTFCDPMVRPRWIAIVTRRCSLVRRARSPHRPPDSISPPNSSPSSQLRGIACVALTLLVGPATFLPVRATSLSEHCVPSERYDIPSDTVDTIATRRAAGGRVVAVGTTSVRALESAANDDGTIRPGPGRTNLVIGPGHRFRAVDGLLTNFHLPRSSLLALVAAFAGTTLALDAYRTATASSYRFYSYGDAMLIL